MRAFRGVIPVLTGGLVALAGCSFKEMSVPPDYSEQPLHSLCDHGRPLTVSNQGLYDNRSGMGDLLLAGQLSNQPVENFMAYRAVRLEYLPDTGLRVTLISPRGDEQTELLPASWISCADDAMELDLPSSAFYIWASAALKTRRLRLQVTTDDGLILRHLWKEQGMMAVVLPVSISGDGWATFQTDDPAQYEPPPLRVSVPLLGECDDLAGTYTVDGISVGLDGSMNNRPAEAQFFRPEIMGDQAPPVEGWIAVALEVSHQPEGSITLALLRDDGTRIERRLDGTRVSCNEGRWLAAGDKELLSPWMLLTGSGGVMWEDLTLWRDDEGALMVRGIYRSRGALFLIPAGSTSEIFVRYKSQMPHSGDDEPISGHR